MVKTRDTRRFSNIIMLVGFVDLFPRAIYKLYFGLPLRG